MKAIILISSIFYILGLKISNKIDLVKRTSPVEKVIMHTVKPAVQEDAIHLKEIESEKKETKDTDEKGNCEHVE